MPVSIKRVILALLVISSLFTIIQYWRLTLGQERAGKSIAALEKRLAPVKEALPFKQGVIGYLADWDVPGASYSFGDSNAEYYLSQYSLAPLILRRGTAPEWTVAVLPPKTFENWIQTRPGEFVTVEIGRGVYLLHRQGNP